MNRTPGNNEPGWYVLLIGGHSGSGKTTLAKEIGLALGRPWVQADDLRLAFRRAEASLPGGAEALHYFDDDPHVWQKDPIILRDALVQVGQALSAPLEAVIENHVDTCDPIVIEGEGILPGLLRRTSVAERAATGSVRSVFLVEPDASEILINIRARDRESTPHDDSERHTEAKAKWLFGQWIVAEADRCGLHVIEPRPWSTLAERVAESVA